MSNAVTIQVVSAIVLILGLGVWWGSTRMNNGNQLGQIDINTNRTPESASPDEAYWNAYWSELVGKAKSQAAATTIGEFTFSIPTSLLRQNTNAGPLYTFNDVPEGPYISFEEVAEKPEAIITKTKSGLRQFERIVAERRETVDGVTWSMIQQTTDFGIDQVTWVAAQTDKTMRVFYTVTRPETTGVFEDIVRSARRSS